MGAFSASFDAVNLHRPTAATVASALVAKRFTQPGTGPTPSISESVSVKWLQLCPSKSYASPGHCEAAQVELESKI
jgi:hypothetical protein